MSSEPTWPDLDDVLGRLDDKEPQTSAEAERVDELHGRIETLMDEIEISLGIEPAVIFPGEPRHLTGLTVL